PRELDAVEAGHHQVRDHDVGPLTSYERESFLAICSLAHNGHGARHGSKEGAGHLPVIGCIVGYDDGQWHRPFSWPRVVDVAPEACMTCAVRPAGDTGIYTCARGASGSFYPVRFDEPRRIYAGVILLRRWATRPPRCRSTRDAAGSSRRSEGRTRPPPHGPRWAARTPRRPRRSRRRTTSCGSPAS